MAKSRTSFKSSNRANPSGRPQKEVATRDLPVITKLAAKGVREKDIARAVGVSEPTWLRIKRDCPEVVAALDAGRQVMHDALVGKLYEKAMRGQDVPILFLLKTVFGYAEGTALGDARPQVIINLPSAVPMEQYRTIEGEAAMNLPATVKGKPRD